MKVEELIKKLELLPHPEGGYYKEVYRSAETISHDAFAQRFSGERNFCTSIYFLIEKNNFSALHKIQSDEIFHFYAGDAMEVIEIDEQGNLKSTLVGNKVEQGEVFQYTVKAGNWFGSRVAKGGHFSLVGCTVSPGFDFEDFEMARREVLLLEFPEHAVLIEEMTRG